MLKIDIQYLFVSLHLFSQEECELVKINIRCQVQGDIVLECIHLEDDLEREEMIYRVMFNTAFVRSNVLLLTRDEVDFLWDVKDLFSKEFKAEVRFSLHVLFFSVFYNELKIFWLYQVLFLDADSVHSVDTSEETQSEDGNEAENASPEEFYEAEEIFSSFGDGQDGKVESDNHVVQFNGQENGNDHKDHKTALKDGLDNHAFEDCSSYEGMDGYDSKMPPGNNVLLYCTRVEASDF